MSAKGKMYLSKSKMNSKNETSVKIIIIIIIIISSSSSSSSINSIHLIHKASHILSTFTNQCHCLHLHSQCLHLPRPHT